MFSEQMWGGTSLHYGKLVRKLTKLKLDEIIHTAQTCIKVKGQGGPFKGHYDSGDDNDEHTLIVASSNDVQIAGDSSIEEKGDTTSDLGSMTKSGSELEFIDLLQGDTTGASL